MVLTLVTIVLLTLSETGSSYHHWEDLGKQDGPMRIEIEPSATEQSPIGYLFLNNTIVTMVKFIVQHSKDVSLYWQWNKVNGMVAFYFDGNFIFFIDS